MSRTKLHSLSILTLALLLCFVPAAQAKLTIPSIFSDYMVLQADADLPVWGRADGGAEITVTLGDQSLTTTADASGRWNVTLGPLPASTAPIEMTIANPARSDKAVIKDILVGEVWLGSGQSNMNWSVARSDNADKFTSEANHPQIRLFTVGRRPSTRPTQDLDGKWVICTPDTVPNFSAVLYHFGINLHDNLKTPVGLIHSSWGGTPIRSWMPREAFSKDEFEAAQKKAEASLKSRKPATAPTTSPWQSEPVVLYNGMIAPLIPYAIRGVTWYQGENNVGDEKYADQMAAMVRIWRTKWSQGDFPFLYVQLAPYGKYKSDPEALPKFWEMQTQALTMISNSGMAPIADLGKLDNIHPTNKHDVGKRLALIALAKTYGKKDVVYQGPAYESHTVDGNKLRLKFTGTGSGLASRDGKDLTHFELAGADGEFHAAHATIEGSEVILASDKVATPKAARFAWSATAEPNLMNNEGFPAVAFRTR